MQLERRPVEVDPLADYREIGVRSFGKGIFHKDPVTGVQLGNKRVFAIKPGDLVLSNVFAWEGAVALASEHEKGMIGSHRFMTYVARDDRILPSWAAWFFLSEPGLDLLGMASPGSAGRNRTLAIDRFENLVVPLPPIEEQQSVAERLDLVRRIAVGTASRAANTAELIEASGDALIEQFLAKGVANGWPRVSLSDVATVNPRPAKLQGDEAVAFVPMAAVDADTGTVTPTEVRTAGEIGSGYKQFLLGDVIFARITPSMQNGKCAVFEGPQKVGYGSTEFHVVRAGPDVRPEWIHRVMRSKGFRLRGEQRFKGTAGQQRVPADFVKTVEIPLPPLSEQLAAVAEIDRVARRAAQLSERRARADEMISALEPSALNREFGTLT